MDIRTWRIVESVARLQSFSRAADEVRLSNAAVSAAVAKAEQDVGLALFERSTRFVRLTPLGERFLPRIRLLVKDHDSLLHDMTQSVQHRSGQVAVGCLTSIAVRIMPSALGDCRHEHPGVRIEIRDAAASAVYDEVATGRTDFAIVSAYAGRPELEFQPMMRDAMALICPAGSKLAARKRVHVDELAAYPLIVMSRETGVRAVLEEALGPLTERLNVSQEVTQLSSLIGMVEEGLGVAMVPMLALPRVVPPTLAVVRGIEPRIERPIGLLRRIDRPLSPAALAVLDCVRRAMDVRAGLGVAA